MNKLLTVALVLAGLPACKKKPNEDNKVAPPTGSASVAATTGDAAPAADAAAPAWDGKTALPLTEGFATPESVLHDIEEDVYLVSNINGQPLDVDDNGYISKVSPEGKVTEAKWIDGAKDNVTLNAPKGLAIVGSTLYVADIDTVRTFDSKTGAPKAEIKIPGATFLNDVAADGVGGVYVSDSGLDPKFASTGTDAIWHISDDGKAKPIAKDKSLSAPNGLIGDGHAVFVVTFGSGELYQIDDKGTKSKVQKLPKGQLDGIAAIDGGDLLVSSWESSAIYRGQPGGAWKPVVENVKSPADIGYDSKRHVLLIPVFMGNTVILQPLQP